MGNDHSSVEIKTDRPGFFAGETVTGTIYVHAMGGFRSKGVFIKVKGYEATKFYETETHTDEEGKMETRHVEREGKREFFKIKYQVHAFPNNHCEGGDMAIPFAVALPPDLPESFEIHRHDGTEREFKARVRYKFKVELDREGMLKSDIKKTQLLVVHAARPAQMHPVHQEGTRNVTFCCCIKKGTATLRATLDKSVYNPGDEARVMCEVENMSSVDIPHLRTVLKRRLKLNARHNHHHLSVTTIARADYDGIPAMTAQTGEEARYIPLRLASEGSEALQPETKGKLVQCEYFLDVQLDVPFSPDIHLHLPVNIVAAEPSMAEWEARLHAPPGWNPALMPLATVPIDPRYAY